jgi:hypothetical protein
VSLHIRPTGLPGLQVEVDLHAGLILAESVRDLDDDGLVAVRAGLTICSPQELEELLLSIWVHLDPHDPPFLLTLGDPG